ncbi:hypothetical protein [Streptomyces sp. NPDC059008]|uniref:hypothetical protein n=1 Tax=Streptomyces sp. NPDC059008 TaxID=3346693 RepID=UPI003696A3CE
MRYVPCPDGVYLYGDRGARTLRGSHAYEWLRRLSPYLTGDHTVDELTAALPPAQRETVETTVRLLREHGFVTDVQDDTPHTLTPAERTTYAPEIAFIACALDSPEHRFQRHRDTRVLLLGRRAPDPVLAAVVDAGVRSGWADIRVASGGTDTDGTGTGTGTWPRAAKAARRDERQRIVATDDTGFAATDIVLQVSDRPHELIAVARECAEADVALAQVLLTGDEAWFSGVGRATETAAESLWHRLRGVHRDNVPPVDGPWLSGPVPALLAAHAVLGCFRHRTGLDESAVEEPHPTPATRLDLRTLDTSTHTALPHPSAARPKAVTTGDPGPLTRSGLPAHLPRLVDEHTGVLVALEAAELPQFPLAVQRAAVSDPYGVLPAWSPPPEEIGWAPDQETARLRALLAALSTYGWLAARPGAAQGLDLVTGEVRRIPERSVPAPARGPFRVPAGVAAGLSRSDALAWALRQHCEALLVAQRAAGASGRTLDPCAAPVDEAGDFLLRQLELARQKVTAWDLTPLLGAPAYAVRAGDGDEVVACASTPQDALADGLERALLAWQGRRTWRGAPVSDETADAVDVLTEAVHKAGHHPVVEDLDGDAALAALVPHMVRVVLREG